MVQNSKKEIRKVINRVYLNKDADALRADLVQYARTFYPDFVQDLSEVGVAGLFLDFASFVGDTQSFYLDHQFKELDPELAVETSNIERHLRNAGVKITGASNAAVALPFAIEVPALAGTSEPDPTLLPVILEGTVVESDSGISFELTEDLDFSSRDSKGEFKARKVIGEVSQNGTPLTVIMTMGGPGQSPRAPDGLCVSGIRATETFRIPNSFEAFREITLGNENVTQIISVTDSDANTYYEVESLAQDTVFRGITNVGEDGELVQENLTVIPAPYRFTSSVDFDTKLVTLRFGAGNAETLEDDIIPDPSRLALPLFGKKTFSRFSLDPSRLLDTQTLGVAPQGTTLRVVYRHGGGLSHNVTSRTINTITTLRMIFPGNPSTAGSAAVRASTAVSNPRRAEGGENAPTLDELRFLIPASRNSQSRIVGKQDLLARIYNMPANFGRVFRAGVRSNPRNPLATQLFIISRDIDGRLAISPDALKLNLRTYLNQFRMISDAIDILDAQVINFGVEFKVTVEPDNVKSVVLQEVIRRLRRYFRIINFQIDQPIKLDDVQNIIYNTAGVLTLIDFKIKNISGNVLDREYSGVKFDINTNIRKKLLVGSPGSIFEMRYPNFDIIGSAI